MFNVEVIKFSTINELPNAWSPSDYRELLTIMDYGDVSDITPEDLKETCMILLSENEPEEAASIVLNYVFQNQLNAGQIANLSNEIQEEKMWEEYADLALHEPFFNVTQLLYETYNGKFPNPEAVQIKLKISAKKSEDLLVFESQTEAPFIRLLVKGMPHNTLINRLFDEQLESEHFEEAKNIIWQLEKEQKDNNTMLFTIISSPYWFKDLKYMEPFEASTYADTI